MLLGTHFIIESEGANACWDPNTGAAGGPSCSNPCVYTSTYPASDKFQAFPTTVTTCAPSATCTPSASGATQVFTCSPAVAAGAASDLPPVTSCITGSGLTGTSTLTTQTSCSGTSNKYCMNTYVASPASVTAACSATCTTSSTVLCTAVSNGNSILTCYTGIYNTITTTTASTWTASICQPISSSSTYVSASYCQNVYSYASSTGLAVTGSCVSSCTAATVTITSTSATGTTCCGTALCNTYPKSSAPILNSKYSFTLFIFFIYILRLIK